MKPDPNRVKAINHLKKRSNGMAEKGVHISKNLIKKSFEEGKELEDVLLEYRCTPIPHLNKAPSELLMSRLLRTTIPISSKKLIPDSQYKK